MTIQQPLRGLRVLDITRVLAGPYASMILGDLGAEVLKIERPSIGDDTRRWGPPFKGSESVYFLSVNRNKKSVAVDFKNPRGAELLRQLATKSDVLIENYIPGKLASFGLDYRSIREVNPRLVYCSVTGYGQTGPWSNRPGYDVVAAAAGGFLHITGPSDGPPCRVGVAVTDLSTGLYSVSGILAALLQRQVTNRGCHIDANLLSTQLATMSMVGANLLTTGVEGSRWGTGHPSIVPYQAFSTADGSWLLIGAGNDSQFVDLCDLLGLETVATEERFRRNEDRVQNRKELVEILQTRLEQRTKDEWMAAFEDAKVKFPFSPVNTVGEAFQLPQAHHLGAVQEMQHDEGKVAVPGPALRFSHDDSEWTGFGKTARAPPVLGGDTDSVLTKVLGLGLEEVAEMRKSGVIG